MRVLATALIVSCLLAASELSAQTPAAKSSYRANPEPIASLEEILDWSGTAPEASEDDDKPVLNIRNEALRESGFQAAAQAALAQRARLYNDRLNAQETVLSEAFRFDLLLLDNGRVLPPVITEARNSTTITADTMRIASQTYRIHEQARFTALAPTWHQYLLFPEYRGPSKPPAALLPHSEEEKQLWREAVEDGWRAGLEQTDRILALNIAKLRRGFIGRVRYHLLRLHGYVSEPFVAVTPRGVVVGGDELTIDETILRITVLPQLQADSSEWRAIPQIPSAFVDPYAP